MNYQYVFKRYELKYVITEKQKKLILMAMEPFMKPDRYGISTIRNLYFDTENYRLIRNSIEKPIYKEKLRLRSYQQVDSNGTIFVEIKKKYDHVTYKRRLSIREKEAMDWICFRKYNFNKSQISEEIDYFIDFYKTLKPVLFISYEREAYCSKNESDLRITFDHHILARDKDLSLQEKIYGESILQEGMYLMEIKCSKSIPLWMVNILSKEHIYKTSFSKYGVSYKQILFKTKGEKL